MSPPLASGDSLYITDGIVKKIWDRDIVENAYLGLDGRILQVMVKDCKGKVQGAVTNQSCYVRGAGA